MSGVTSKDSKFAAIVKGQKLVQTVMYPHITVAIKSVGPTSLIRKICKIAV